MSRPRVFGDVVERFLGDAVEVDLELRRESLFRQPDRQILALSPFRLGEEPNVRVGVAMITSAPEALSLHQKQAEGMWQRALKGGGAASFLRDLIARHRE